MEILLLTDVEVQWQLTCARFDEWLGNDVFRFKWWLMLVLFISTAYFWWKIVDKSRLNEIILYAALITLIVILLDELGEELTLWNYTTDLFPLFPPITAVDLACLPVVYSIIYQYCRTWKSFTIATLVMAIIICFVLEPIFVWIGVYQMLEWKSIYGFPIYTSMAIITKAVVNKIYLISLKS